MAEAGGHLVTVQELEAGTNAHEKNRDGAESATVELVRLSSCEDGEVAHCCRATGVEKMYQADDPSGDEKLHIDAHDLCDAEEEEEEDNPSNMDTDVQDDASPLELGMPVLASATNDSTDAEEEEEARKSGKEVSRCNSGNLDSGVRNGRREGSQGNSRHICKHCYKDFASGRALGGHMRAHGSLSMDEGPYRATLAKLDKYLCVSPKQTRNNNTDSGSDHALSNSAKSSPSPYSKRARSKEFRSWRSASRNSKLPTPRPENSPKNSRDADNNTAAKEEDDAVSLPASSSSEANDDGLNDDGAATNECVCNVCFEVYKDPKSLSSHKKTHGIYGLRRNPKRSRRFIDQDYTLEATAASAPAKKPSSIFTEQVERCSECGKQFSSWKALFGHMRCHPERAYRGIMRPQGSAGPSHPQHHQQPGGSGEPQFPLSSRRKKPQPSCTSMEESDSEPEPEPDIKKRKGKETSDNGSDTESIEAAYMNGEQRQSTGKGGWNRNTGKRSKRSRQIVRSLQAVTKPALEEDVKVSDPPEPCDSERETAMGLMMLASKQAPEEASWLEGRSSEELLTKENRRNLESGSFESEGEQLGKFRASLSGEQRPSMHKKEGGNSKRKAVKEEGSHSEENEEGEDDYDGAELGAGSAKPKYMCNTCKRVFKSHQALGGHRASHKKVKGCFARTNVSDGVHDIPEEDMTSEEFLKSEEQLPNDLQDVSQSDGEEKERQFSLSKDDSGEMINGAKKLKGHICTICGRDFSSGQALGGHKRCHWNGAGTSSEATSSTNTGKLPAKALKEDTVKQARPAEEFLPKATPAAPLNDEIISKGAQVRYVSDMVPHRNVVRPLTLAFPQPVRAVKEKLKLDLNLPAHENDSDVEPNFQTENMDQLYATKFGYIGERVGNIAANGVVSSNFDKGIGKVKQEETSLIHHLGKVNVAQVEECTPDTSGADGGGLRGGAAEFNYSFVVNCNICDICGRQFSSIDALNKHQKTHVSSVIPSIKGPATILA